LHGFLNGIIIDGEITKDEVLGLRDWIHDYQIFKNSWPFNATWKLVERIFADNVVTEQEKAELMEFCKEFSETIINNAKIHDEIYSKSWIQSDASILQPFTALCDRNEKIIFTNKKFCFTGPARTGPRKELNRIVKSIGGIPCNSVILDLDYLVIGAQSSPAWAYSTYGRKIEKVIEYRERGSDITILHEDDFIAQAKQIT
jgi:NAD-dependent DNA ligase